ncbi:MAG: hypothetical protein LBJ14_05530 [Desulfarculales bacterium]|jgi:hypothetical protein|nr:hypothetical protein [Desulfarculales bacterium]
MKNLTIFHEQKDPKRAKAWFCPLGTKGFKNYAKPKQIKPNAAIREFKMTFLNERGICPAKIFNFGEARERLQVRRFYFLPTAMPARGRSLNLGVFKWVLNGVLNWG